METFIHIYTGKWERKTELPVILAHNDMIFRECLIGNIAILWYMCIFDISINTYTCR